MVRHALVWQPNDVSRAGTTSMASAGMTKHLLENLSQKATDTSSRNTLVHGRLMCQLAQSHDGLSPKPDKDIAIRQAMLARRVTDMPRWHVTRR